MWKKIKPNPGYVELSWLRGNRGTEWLDGKKATSRISVSSLSVQHTVILHLECSAVSLFVSYRDALPPVSQLSPT